MNLGVMGLGVILRLEERLRLGAGRGLMFVSKGVREETKSLA